MKTPDIAALQRKGSVRKLLKVLDHPEFGLYTREKAARAIGELGAPAAVDGLVSALDDPEITIRLAAEQALVSLGEPAAEALAVAKASDRARAHIAVALGKLGDQRGVEPLIATLRHDHTAFRSAELLGELGDPRAVEPLIEALRYEDGLVRARAAEALGKLGEPRAVGPLIAQANAHPEEANTALAELGSKGLLDMAALAEMARADATRQLAMLELGRLGDPRGIDMLIAALEDEGEQGRMATTRYGLGAAATEALLRFGSVAVEPLIAAVRRWDGHRLRLGIEVLGRLGDPRAVEPLVEALSHEDEAVRSAAASGLSAIGDPGAVEPLLLALADESAAVRAAAASSLGKLGDRCAVEPLIKVLTDPFCVEQASVYDRDADLYYDIKEYPVRDAAAQALARLGGADAERALSDYTPGPLRRAVGLQDKFAP